MVLEKLIWRRKYGKRLLQKNAKTIRFFSASVELFTPVILSEVRIVLPLRCEQADYVPLVNRTLEPRPFRLGLFFAFDGDSEQPGAGQN
jgi:hypothetical protein